jgi:ferredoxin
MTNEGAAPAVARIEINREICSGHARCVAIAPEFFDIDDDGFSVALRQPGTPDELEDAKRAAGGCPEQAITIVEVD